MKIMKIFDIIILIIAVVCLGLCINQRSYIGVFAWVVAVGNSFRIIMERE